MRLASGQTGTSLSGMAAVADIPECWGVHGVHESGRTDFANRTLEWLQEKENSHNSDYLQHLRLLSASKPIFEEGGVNVMRPLLSFSKSRLIETCRASGVEWEEDQTNMDVWRTPRNTIRKMLSSSALPGALRKRSILNLALRKLIESQKAVSTAGKIFMNCEILLFDVRCGSLLVRFPHRTLVESKSGLQHHRANARMTATIVLRRCIRLVTPQEEVPLSTLRFAALSIFPDLRGDEFHDDPRLQESGFTACGVLFERLTLPLPDSVSDNKRSQSEESVHDWKVLDPKYVWKLTRQPFSRARVTVPTIMVPPLALRISPPLAVISTPPLPCPKITDWTFWELWDGRYWFRVLNNTPRPLIVRPLQSRDLREIKAKIPSAQWELFHSHLGQIAPGKSRWTLPIIAELDDTTEGLGRVLVLPTLGQAGHLHTKHENGSKLLEWEVRYKQVRLGWKGNRSETRNKDIVTSWND